MSACRHRAAVLRGFDRAASVRPGGYRRSFCLPQALKNGAPRRAGRERRPSGTPADAAARMASGGYPLAAVLLAGTFFTGTFLPESRSVSLLYCIAPGREDRRDKERLPPLKHQRRQPFCAACRHGLRMAHGRGYTERLYSYFSTCRRMAWKDSSLITCSMRQASSAAVFSSTPRRISRSVSTVWRS